MAVVSSPVSVAAAQVRLRLASAEDAGLLLAWRNRPEIVALGSQRRQVSPAEHEAWFAESLRDSVRRVYLILVDDAEAGQLRFDWAGAAEAEVSIYLLPEFCGRGWGESALRKGISLIEAERGPVSLVARVRRDNVRSLRFFQRAGFDPVESAGKDTDHWRLVRAARVVPHNRLTRGEAEEAAVVAVVRSGRWAGGERMRELEVRMAAAGGTAHGVAVGSGLGGLRLALRSLGVGPGQAVAIPAYACVALANAVLACGADPVAVDVEEGSWTLSPRALRRAVAERSDLAAVIAVHTFGARAPIDEIAEVGLPVIEDCSHAFGRTGLGSGGTLAVASLYATKLLGAGEGGMVLTSDGRLAEAVRIQRDYTDRAPGADRLNDKMSELTAALALCQLERLPAMLADRDRLAAGYQERLTAMAASGRLVLPLRQRDRIWYRFAVEVDGGLGRVVAGLARRGVMAAIPVTPWCHPLPAASTGAGSRLLSLPLYPTLTSSEQDQVVEALDAVLPPSLR